MNALYGIWGEDGTQLSRPLLCRAVRLLWGWTKLPELTRSDRGKPEFADGGHWLSLAHSGGCALCALSDEGPIGADVELVRPHREGLPRYVMSREEFGRFDGSWEDFSRIWTLKEAFCKRTDMPLFPPREVRTPPDCPYRSYKGRDWRAAICCTGEPPEDILWLDSL